MELNAIGFRSPWAFFWYCLWSVAPLAYVYISLMLLRDLCEYFPSTIQQPLQQYVPWLSSLARLMKSYYGFRLVDVWCVIEALFFIFCKLKVRYLQSRDPLESSLSAAPMLDAEERKALWDHMMEVDSDLTWVTGWFLDQPPIESMSRYDILDFVCWAMFDGRNQEHLTTQELQDLEGFVEELEYRISLTMYGVKEGEETDEVMASLELVEEEKDEESTTEPAGQEGQDGLTIRSGGNDDDGDNDDTLPRRNRTSSSNLSTTCQPNRNDSYQNFVIEEDGYNTPRKDGKQRYSSEEDSTLGSGSDSWSLASSRKPRPKKCTSL